MCVLTFATRQPCHTLLLFLVFYLIETDLEVKCTQCVMFHCIRANIPYKMSATSSILFTCTDKEMAKLSEVKTIFEPEIQYAMRTCEIFENFAKIFTACQNSLIQFTRFWNIIWKSNSVLCTAFKNKKLKRLRRIMMNYTLMAICGQKGWKKYFKVLLFLSKCIHNGLTKEA